MSEMKIESRRLLTEQRGASSTKLMWMCWEHSVNVGRSAGSSCQHFLISS